MIRYLTAVAAFYLAVFVHVILFNLHLADLGFREEAMGQLGAAMTAGTLLAAIVRTVVQNSIAAAVVAKAPPRGESLSPHDSTGTIEPEGGTE